MKDSTLDFRDMDEEFYTCVNVVKSYERRSPHVSLCFMDMDEGFYTCIYVSVIWMKHSTRVFVFHWYG